MGQTLGTLFVWCLVPLAAIGVIRRRDVTVVPIWPLVVSVIVVVVNSMLTYGNQRLRMGAEPSIVVLATIGLIVVARALSGTRTRQRPPSPSGLGGEAAGAVVS